MDRLERILKERKLKGLKWGDLAANLPVTGEGLRIAFARGSVQEEYLEVVEQMLGINKDPTKTTIEENSIEDLRIEDLIAKKVIEQIRPYLKEFQEAHVKRGQEMSDIVHLLGQVTVQLSKLTTRNEQLKNEIEEIKKFVSDTHSVIAGS